MPAVDPAKSPWLDPAAQIDSLSESDSRVRTAAAINLGNMGAKAAEALPALDKAASDDSDQRVREKAREAAEKIRAAMGDGG